MEQTPREWLRAHGIQGARALSSAPVPLVMRGPEDVLAYLPFALGYMPQNSTVLVSFGRRSHSASQRLSGPLARFDLRPSWLGGLLTGDGARPGAKNEGLVREDAAREGSARRKHGAVERMWEQIESYMVQLAQTYARAWQASEGPEDASGVGGVVPDVLSPRPEISSRGTSIEELEVWVIFYSDAEVFETGSSVTESYGTKSLGTESNGAGVFGIAGPGPEPLDQILAASCRRTLLAELGAKRAADRLSVRCFAVGCTRWREIGVREYESRVSDPEDQVDSQREHDLATTRFTPVAAQLIYEGHQVLDTPVTDFASLVATPVRILPAMAPEPQTVAEPVVIPEPTADTLFAVPPHFDVPLCEVPLGEERAAHALSWGALALLRRWDDHLGWCLEALALGALEDPEFRVFSPRIAQLLLASLHHQDVRDSLVLLCHVGLGPILALEDIQDLALAQSSVLTGRLLGSLPGLRTDGEMRLHALMDILKALDSCDLEAKHRSLIPVAWWYWRAGKGTQAAVLLDHITVSPTEDALLSFVSQALYGAAVFDRRSYRPEHWNRPAPQSGRDPIPRDR